MGAQKVKGSLRARGAHQKTLDMEHSAAMERLERARADLQGRMEHRQSLAARHAELAARARHELSDQELDELLQLTDVLKDMEGSIETAKATCDDVDYFLKTGSILFKYYEIIDKGSHLQHTSPCFQQEAPEGQESPAPPMTAVTPAAVSKPAAALPVNSIMRFFKSAATTVPAALASAPASALAPAAQAQSGGSADVDGGADAPTTTAQVCPPQPTPATNKMTLNVAQQTLRGGSAGSGGDDRASLLEKYLSCTDKDFIKPEPADFSMPGGGGMTMEFASSGGGSAGGSSASCSHCGGMDRTVMIHDGYIYCNDCFTLEYVLVDHEKPSYKDPPKEITYFAYKRINHFNEWLNQVQGKETTEIPDEVYDKILLEIKKQKITNMADLTNAKVREILKKLKINKYYEHIPHIINRLSGVSMPHIPPELEDRLRHMFCQIQVPFLKHSPASRKNFLSYSYVLHKFMQLLEKDEFVSSFPLLKSRDKLICQDLVWAKICAELGWEFVRSL